VTDDKIYFTIGNRRLRKYDVVTVDGDEVLIETEDWKNFRREKSALIALERQGILLGDFTRLDQYTGADEPKNIEKLKSFIANFGTKHKHTHLYIYSASNSTQKTTVSKIVAKELAIKGFSVMFINMDDLVKKLTQENFDDSGDEILAKVRECEFLVIDDSFDPSKMTLYKSKYQLSFLDSFLRLRLETTKKSTCFTSNTVPDKIGDVFDRHIEALILRNAFPMHFKDSIHDFDLGSIWS
jgi:DNA replication protein DnaC